MDGPRFMIKTERYEMCVYVFVNVVVGGHGSRSGVGGSVY